MPLLHPVARFSPSRKGLRPQRINALLRDMRGQTNYLEVGTFLGHTVQVVWASKRVGVDPDNRFNHKRTPGLLRGFRTVAVKLRFTRPSATAGPGVFCPPRWRFSVTEARFNADVIDHAVLRDINHSLTSHQIGWARTCFVPAYQAPGLP